MRPYLVLCAVVLMAVAAFGQQTPAPRVFGPCLNTCGPYVPLVTTPEITFENVSPNPVGARNATTGLIAGATDSTLSQIQGDTSSVYSEAVWYHGGDAPLVSPEIHLNLQTIGHAGRPMHEMHELREEREVREEKREGWIFYSGSAHTSSAVEASAAAKGM